MRSSISLGMVSGLIGYLAKCMVLFEPHHTKKRKQKNLPTHRFADLVSGAVLGIPLVYYLKKTGKDRHIVKGASFGVLLWAFFYSARGKNDRYLCKHRKCRSELLDLLSNLLFGVVTACVAIKIADPETYPDDAEYDFGF
ncbi:hypothetical protein [Desulfitobacterium sp.]|uniref:hypothetical protein n=1 Tax=Desulfitobacterium sp. TaxID=49981 RepID=UPI002CDE161A|nr:hypothetical protein [Desulfitobacterium sp.]HVJ47845.1 hypothetical protein [Desulfitobacterium sp.]